MGKSKLTPEDIEEIKRRAAIHRDNAIKRIAADYGISAGMVSLIANGLRHRKRPKAAP